MAEKKPKLVKGTGGPVQVNQTSPIFNDRRTKRNRDRSTQKRTAIREASE